MNLKQLIILGMLALLTGACSSNGLDFSAHPSTTIANGEVEMLLYLPDAEKGLYRATRFDWSGVIMSATYRDHEYFGYWKPTHDPLFHEDLAGPVEGYITPGPGYDEAQPGEGFIRIGVGVLEKEDEEGYQWNGTYNILDHGTWTTQQGEDWITFTHKLKTDFGYAYVYKKTIRLKEDGFTIGHVLVNNGEKLIETDQFNHNFFMIDGEESGPAFEITFAFEVSSDADLKGLYLLEGNTLNFPAPMDTDSLFVPLKGFSQDLDDHHVSVLNKKSGAGVSFSVDRPLHAMGFWSCAPTLSPENSIWLSVPPGQQEEWTADYTFFIKE